MVNDETAVTVDMPVYDGDFYSDETILNPFPVYHELREMGRWCGWHNTTVMRCHVQNDLEKASNAQIAVCCSRSKSKMLVLDL